MQTSESKVGPRAERVKHKTVNKLTNPASYVALLTL